ncbi:hypothetical protein Salat_0452300 [Sesamum alatum]|uniref:Uncharacterized protein n=1 Tax=Sesamum alatum TaxID=300844 RepID=A0AAE1Z3L8_9LAMI|nr:hypothetical protein Salat_0452300 [Sesamum alatum]
MRKRMAGGAEQCMEVEVEVEVAPSPLVFPLKPSQCPTLETIKEEERPAAEEEDEEEGEDWEDKYAILVLNLKYWFLHILSRFWVAFSHKLLLRQQQPTNFPGFI